MQKLGLKPINKESCLFIGCGIIVLVYVNDILIIYPSYKHHEAAAIAQALEEHYDLCYEGQDEGFLSVKITCDREQCIVHLSNTDYI